MIRSGSSGDDADASAWQADEKRLLQKFEQLSRDLSRRDSEAQRDPWALQRWPMERKTYADRVDTARDELESHRKRGRARDGSRSPDGSDPGQ